MTLLTVLDEPVKKKQKRFGEEFETGNVSDEYDDESGDELNKYLEQRIDMASIDDIPLTFWYKYQSIYPILSKLARSIYSIPAITANVERQFSAGGLMIHSRRTRLNPGQVNNALFLRSVRKLVTVIVFYCHLFMLLYHEIVYMYIYHIYLVHLMK